MDLGGNGCLEELLSQRREDWEAYFSGGVGDLYFSRENGGCFDYCCFDERGGGMGAECSFLPNRDLDAIGLPADLGFGCCPDPIATYFSPPPPAQLGAIPQLTVIPPAVQSPSSPATITGATTGATVLGRYFRPFSPREEHMSTLEGEESGLAHRLLGPVHQVPSKLEELNRSPTGAGGPNSKACGFPALPPLPAFDVGSSSSSSRLGRKVRPKRVGGQPSKNLLAERRRRKRLNDRLSMLRSVVPKISKMDRTSILGDTIDYMKELLDRIRRLQVEMESSDGSTSASSEEAAPPPVDLLSLFSDLLIPNEVFVRNSAPKFDVERREVDTRVEICCARNPGLLLSILSTLEMLGLEIQQCVISCFNDFGMQASCSERALVSSEQMKLALFRNAG